MSRELRIARARYHLARLQLLQAIKEAERKIYRKNLPILLRRQAE